MGQADRDAPARLRDVAAAFLRLGITAFGGPAVHIAMMEDEFVRRRKWLPRERFLDLLGAANLIPGPSSSELAVYIGQEVAGWAGLLVAGACFVLPAATMVGLLAWVYVGAGALPRVGGALYGVKPVVIAVVAQALVGLAPKAIRTRGAGAIAALACAAFALGIDALAVLLAAGAIAAATKKRAARDEGGARAMALPWLAHAGGATLASAPVSMPTLFLTFTKIGAVVFGSGYVLLAFLRADLVDRLHWITEAQLLDAIAVGQVTPGPVFTTATFIGYLVGGARGAILSTIAIFLPGFTIVAITRPLVARLRTSARASAFLDGVNAASLALMAVVGFALARAAIVDAVTAAIAIASIVALLRFRVNTTWLVVAGAAVGSIALG